MVLESIWFFLWGLLWAIYFMTDGFDLGIGSLLPKVKRIKGSCLIPPGRCGTATKSGC